MPGTSLGIRLLLLVGKTIPVPAPADLVNALRSVEVTNDARSGDGFQMTLSMGKDSVADYGLLLAGTIEPMTRVVICLVVGAVPEVLIDGVVTNHQFQPSLEPGQSTLTVTGSDCGVLLDLEEKNAKFENQSDSCIAGRLLLNYVQLGLVPRITATTDVPISLERVPRQQETDLRFLRRLAERNGFVFYLEPLAPGSTAAHWGPEDRLSSPQAALSMNMGPATNLKSLSFARDALAPAGTKGSVMEPATKESLPIPSLPTLRSPPLSLAPDRPVRTTLQRQAASLSPAHAATAALAAVTASPVSVNGQGEIDTLRYGGVLRAHRLVTLRGVGRSYDGGYYVSRVTHNIERGKYEQRFSICREGIGSLLSAVRA